MDDDTTEPTGGHAEPSEPGRGDPSEQRDATGPRSARFSRGAAAREAGGLRRAPDASEPVSRDDTPPFGRRRRGRFAIGGVAVLVVGALVAALFVLPVKAWLGQRRALAEAEEQLDVIWRENKRLEGVYDELQTDEVIEQQAREQFGLIKPGEQALSVLPAPAATGLPTGWPYDQVQAILWIRIAAEANTG
jgi:cell division protein FtsB